MFLHYLKEKLDMGNCILARKRGLIIKITMPESYHAASSLLFQRELTLSDNTMLSFIPRYSAEAEAMRSLTHRDSRLVWK